MYDYEKEWKKLDDDVKGYVTREARKLVAMWKSGGISLDMLPAIMKLTVDLMPTGEDKTMTQTLHNRAAELMLEEG